MSEVILGGPMFEPARHDGFKRVESRPGDGGAHYSVWHLDCGENEKVNSAVGMSRLRSMFPDAVADPENFVLFSTSGVHGSYVTLEEIQASLEKYGSDFDARANGEPEDWFGDELTVLVVQPRIVCMRCGNVKVTLADIDYLKRLRESSRLAAMSHFE